MGLGLGRLAEPSLGSLNYKLCVGGHVFALWAIYTLWYEVKDFVTAPKGREGNAGPSASIWIQLLVGAP